MTVVIDPNIKREAVRIDIHNNEIDPKTKQVIKREEKDYVPEPVSVQTGPITEAQFNPNNGLPVSIKVQIEEAEKHLAHLKELRKEEIERKRAELAELEASE